MSFNAIRQAVEDQFIAIWTGTPLDQVNYGGNLNFTPTPNVPWIRLQVVSQVTNNAEIGTNFVRNEGLINAGIFVPVDSGESLAFDLADQVAQVYQNQDFNGIYCLATNMIRLGVTDNWYQINANTPYRTDKTLTP